MNTRLIDAPGAALLHLPNMAPLLAQIDALTEAGQLRRLSGAFARFILALNPTNHSSAPLLLACTVLSELEGRGHSCLMLDTLAKNPAILMGWPEQQWRALEDAAGPLPASSGAWYSLLSKSESVWQVGALDRGQPLVLDDARLYLRRYWRDETLVAQAIRARAGSASNLVVAKVWHWLDILFDRPVLGGGTDWQKIACAIALRSKVAIITGGPGTGKTYTVASLLTLLFAVSDRPERLRIALAAPTGKAAARLKQSIDAALGNLAEKVGSSLALPELAKRMGAARTLHSLLGARPDTRAFLHHAGNLLDVDVLIVDEASMVHLEMMAALLDALPPNAILVLLGDKDQLASVEAGAVLGDLCHKAEAGGYSAATLAYVHAATGQHIDAALQGTAGALAQQTVMLRYSHRFSGPIGELANAVNTGQGEAALNRLRTDRSGQLAWIEAARPADVLALALAGRTGTPEGYQPYLRLVLEGAAGQQGHEAWVCSVLQSFERFRILCAVRDGEWGVGGLNAAIEQHLERAGLLKRSAWYVGRPVMVTRNDYGIGVFNGDIGVTLRDPARPASLRVYFLEGSAVRSVLATRLRHVDTAFAMTVHKSQGSEFAHTVLVLPKDGGAMLTRELVYTGITRARDFLTLVTPTRTALLDAIGRDTQRASGLRSKISG